MYGNVDIKAHKSNSISKTMFSVHVNEMHCNRDEGFKREFEVSVYCVCRNALQATGILASISNGVV